MLRIGAMHEESTLTEVSESALPSWSVRARLMH
jgi:hypothetical protein